MAVDVTAETRIERPVEDTGSPSGFARVTARVMELAMRRAMTKDLAALKRRLEA
jgi:hypothetical protein